MSLSWIIGLIGTLLGIYCVYEVFTKKPATDLVVKILVSILVLCTSWVGLLLYFLVIRDRLQ